MEKRVAASEARHRFGRLLHAVATKGDSVVVERHGEPIAAVVPIELYRQWMQDRRRFFAAIREAAARADLTPDEADELAREAVVAARRPRGT